MSRNLDREKKGETIEANSLRTVYRLGAAETHFKTEAAAAGAHKETLDRGRRALTFLAEAGAAKVAAAASSRRLRRDCTKSCIGHLEHTFLALEEASSLQRRREGPGTSI